MLLTAIIIAQILDPVRIILVGIAFFACRLAERQGAGWLALIVALAAIAAFFPFVIFGQTGDAAWITAAVGVISNALIVLVLAGLQKLYRRVLRSA